MLELVRVVGVLLGVMILLLVGMMGYLRQKPSTAALIAFTMQDENCSCGYLMFPDGSNQRLIGEFPPRVDLIWLPDAKSVVYQAGFMPIPALYRINLDGSRREVILDNFGWADSAPIISPDGQWIVFHADEGNGYDVYRVRLDGSDFQRLTDVPQFDSGASFSPDGQWIAYVSAQNSNYEIFRMRPDGSEKQQLTASSMDETSPIWSPDGEWIFYSALHSSIFRVRPDGSGVERITDLNTNIPVLSPDGKWIVFIANPQGNSDIYRIRSDGSDYQRLTFDPKDDLRPQYSPDGQWIVFVASPHGIYAGADIYRMRANGTSMERLTYTQGFDHRLTWSPIIDMAWDSWKVGAVGVGLMMGAGALSLWGRRTKV